MQQFIHASVQERRSLMLRSLKETNFHGTPMFPLQIYSHKDKNGFYSVTAHWHEELEFLYIEEGTMHGIISGTPYEMKAGEFYFINSGELHELSTHNHSCIMQSFSIPNYLILICMMPVSTISSSQSHRRNCSSQTTSPVSSIRKNEKVSDSFFLQ